MTARISASLNNLTREFDTIANNLANVSTTGYKRRINNFSKQLESLEPSVEKSEKDPPVNTVYDLSQGNVVHTGRPLDFALYGDGFFVIETPDGPLYTRDGMFRANQNGQIVDAQGRIVSGQNGPLSIPSDVGLSQLTVSDSGQISANGLSIGKFKLVNFPNDQDKILPVGSSCFKVSEDVKPTEAEDLLVKQGFQESSNVKMIDELVDLIMVSRLYESNMKFMTSKKDASGSLLNVAMG